MLFVIDVGNTNMVFGLFDGEELAGSFRLRTDPRQTTDEIGLMLDLYLRRLGLAADQIEAVVIDSVVPDVMRALTGAIRRYLEQEPYVIDGNLDPGLPYGVESNERLGPDRAVADIAALDKYGAPLIVVDFGTATTVDALSREGTYLGGCITAGMQISAEALAQKAAMLPSIDLTMPSTVLGATAVGQIQAGAVMGYIGAIEYLIRRTKQEMGYPAEEIRVVATGGLAQMVADHTDLIDIVDRRLILDGLRLIYRRITGQKN